MKKGVSHLSEATRFAIHQFRVNMRKRFYTDKMAVEEEAAVLAIPEDEMAEYVRITTEMQNGE